MVVRLLAWQISPHRFPQQALLVEEPGFANLGHPHRSRSKRIHRNRAPRSARLPNWLAIIEETALSMFNSDNNLAQYAKKAFSL